MPVFLHISDCLERLHCTYTPSPEAEDLMLKLPFAQASQGCVSRIQESLAQLCSLCHLLKSIALWVHLNEGPTEDGGPGVGMKSGCQEEAGLRPPGSPHWSMKMHAPGSEGSWGGGPTESNAISSVSPPP